MQVGYPRLDGATVARAIKAAGLTVPVELMCVAFASDWKDDIDVAVDSGPDVIQLLMRSSLRLLRFLGISAQEAIDRSAEAVAHARGRGAPTVVFATSFSTQTDPAFLEELMRGAVGAGADRASIADSMGVARPAAIAYLVRRLRPAVEVPVAVHCHNDFGLGVACTLAGLEAGATWADVSVNGIGERGGNASLEQVAMALSELYGVDTGLHTEKLHALSRTVSRILRTPLPSDRPVVGDNVFAQKLDMHVRVAARQPDLFEPFDPRLVGGERAIRLGKGSGPFAVGTRLEELGLPADEAVVGRVVEWVNRRAEETKRAVGIEELLEFVQEVSDGP